MKKVAIIGSESFLARNFIEYCRINKLQYSFDLYDYCERSQSNYRKYTQIDFLDDNSIDNIDFSVDAVLVFTGKTGTTEGLEKYKEFIIVNEIMMLNILHAIIKSEYKPHIIYPSTRLLYKSNEKEKITENSLFQCKSIYACTKRSAEEYLSIYKSVYGINYTILRICTPIGTLISDFGNYGTFETFKNQAIKNGKITVFGDGKQKKTFTQIKDICRAFTLLVDKQIPQHEDYNLGGQELSLLDIATHIAKEYNVRVDHIDWPEVYKKVDGGSVVFDSSRFDQEFNMSYLATINKD